MSNMIFDLRDESILDHQAQQVDLVTVNQDNVMQPAPDLIIPDTDITELEYKLDGISMAMEDLTSLDRIKKALSKSTPSKSTIKIGQLAVENSRKRLGIFELTSGNEDASRSELSVTVESISSIITKTIEAIVKTIKYIWKIITEFFSGKKAEQATKKVIDLEKSILEAITSGKYKATIENMDTPISSLFDFVGKKEVSYNELVENVHKCKQAGDRSSRIVKPLVETTKRMVAIFNEPATTGSTIEDTYDGKIDAAISGYNNSIENSFQVDSRFKSLLKAYVNDGSYKLDCEEYRPVGIFPGGDLLYFGKRKNFTGKDNFHLDLVKTVRNEDICTLKLLPLPSLLMYVKEVKVLSEISSAFSDLVEASLKPVEHEHNKVLDFINKGNFEDFMIELDGEYSSKYRKMIYNLKEILDSAKSVTFISSALTGSVIDHAKIAGVMFKQYKAE